MSLEERLQTLERKVNILIITVVLLVVIGAAKLARGEEVVTTAQAVGWALSDLVQIPAQDRAFQRYVWIPPWGTERWIAAINFSVNTAASHATTIQLATPIANGWMLRYDLRRLAPTLKQFETLRTTWDGLAVQDAYFHIPATNTGLQIAVISPHLSQEQSVTLAGLTLSTGAIYRADFLLAKMLSTVEGGQYYEFLQVPLKGKNPQAEWFATLGVFEDATQNLRGDQRSAIFRSNVSAKPRRIDVFFGLGRGGNLVTITHDIGDEDVAAGQHPIRNLIAFQDRAREIIIQRPNGTHAFALTNAKGEFQRSAPDNVVRDHTVPSPHTSRLYPAIACIRCHGAHNGYQPFGNDVQKLLATKINVFDDLGVNLSREEAVDRLAGLYAGQLDVPDGPIGRGRRDYLTVCYKISQGVFPVDQSPVTALSAEVSDVFAGYRYDMVTPEQACLELGLKTEDGVQGLTELLGELTLGVAVDPVEGALRSGIPVNRFEFEPIFVDLSLKSEAKRQGKTVSQILPLRKRVPEQKPVTKKKAA